MPTDVIRVTCTAAATLNLDQLEPFQGELKSLSKPAFAKLRASILEHGVAFPFFVWKSGKHFYTIDGHQRERVLNAMREEGFVIPPLPVVWIKAANENEAKRKILLASSNYGAMDEDSLYEFIKTNNLDWDAIKLELDLPQIDLRAFDLGWMQDLPPAPEAQIDRADALQRKWKTKRGQLWEIPSNTAAGKVHRLLCGDATNADDLASLMQGERAAMLFTDPPYNVNYSGRGQQTERTIENDNMLAGDFEKWLLKVGQTIDPHLKPGAAIYVFHGSGRYFVLPFLELFKDRDWHRSSTIVWAKQCASMGWGDYREQHESISYGWKQGAKHFFTPDRTQTTLWTIPRDGAYLHPTQKPTDLAVRACQNSTQEGWLVLDPFAGGGFCLIGCEQTGRVSRSLELEPNFCAVILERASDMGLKPRLTAANNPPPAPPSRVQTKTIIKSPYTRKNRASRATTAE